MTNYDFFVISTVTPQEISPEPTPRTSQKIWFVVVDDGNTYYPVKMCLANGDKWGDPVDIDASANNGNTNLSITNRGANTLDIASDTGDDATIPAATTTQAGLQSAEDKTKLDSIAAGAQVNTVNSVAGKTGAVTLTQSDVGLSNVDNTSDADKPISAATQTALNGKQPANTKLTAIAGLTGATPIRSDGTNGPLTDAEIPASIARDSEVTAAVTAHAGAIDPHPQYLTAAEGNAAYQPLDPDLTAIAALTTPGLVERTGAGTAATRSIGATGAASLAAANAAAGRAAIGYIGGASNNLPGTLVVLPGEASSDPGMTGFFDRSESTIIDKRGGSITATITAGPGSVGGPNAITSLVDASGATNTLLTGCNATTELEIVIDFGANQTNYARARWIPFVLFRGELKTSPLVSYFNNIQVHASTEAAPTTWVTADGNAWIDTDAKGANQVAPGLWMAPEATLRTTGFIYRYVRFRFSDYIVGTTVGSTLFLNEIGFRHVSSPFARQLFRTDGGSIYGETVVQNGSGSLKTTIGQGTIRVGENAGAISGTESVTTTLSSPGAGWSFSWARAQVGDEIRISPTNGSTVAITGRCATAGTVLADTSAWTAGLQIQLRIIRMAA